MHARAAHRGGRRAEDEADAALGEGAARDRHPAGRPGLPLAQPLSRELRAKIALFADVRPATRSSPTRTQANIYQVPLALRAQGFDDLVLERFHLEAPEPDLDGVDASSSTASTSPTGEVHDRRRRQVRPAARRVQVGQRGAAARRHRPRRGARARPSSTRRACRAEEAIGSSGGRRRRADPGRLRRPRHRGQDRRRALRARARRAVLRHLPRHAGAPSSSSRATSCGLEGANSTEFDRETPYPVVDLMPEQNDVQDKGGTMRLGAEPVVAAAGHARARGLRSRPGQRAPPPPLRGQRTHLRPQLEAARPGASGRVRGQGPRRDDRARRTTRTSWRASSTPSSSRARRGRPRCSATSSARPWSGAPDAARRRGRRERRRLTSDARALLHRPRRRRPVRAPGRARHALGAERAAADLCLAYLRELGLEPDEDGAASAIDGDAGNIYAHVPGTVDGHADLPLRAPRHGAGGRADRAGHVERPHHQRARRHPRCGQQGVGGRHARRRAAGARRGHPARGHRARADAPGGGRPDRRARVRRDAAAGARRLRVRPRRADRRHHHAGAEPEGRQPHVHRRLRARRHRAGARPQRRPGGGARDLADDARPPRRGHDRERRHDRGRLRAQRRARSLHGRGRGAEPRPRALRDGGGGDDRGRHRRRGRDGVRRRTSTCASCTAPTACRPRRRRTRLARGRAGGRGLPPLRPLDGRRRRHARVQRARPRVREPLLRAWSGSTRRRSTSTSPTSRACHGSRSS